MDNDFSLQTSYKKSSASQAARSSAREVVFQPGHLIWSSAVTA